MKSMNLLLLGALAAGGALLLSQKSATGTPGGAPTPVDVQAGKTYQITIRAVGAKISDQEVSDNVKVFEALGSTVKNTSLNDARDTLTITLLAGRNSRVVVNQFYPNPANPNTGAIFTAITEVPSSGAVPQVTPTYSPVFAAAQKAAYGMHPGDSPVPFTFEDQRYVAWVIQTPGGSLAVQYALKGAYGAPA